MRRPLVAELAAGQDRGVRVPYIDFPAQFSAHRDEILGAIERVLERGDFILGGDVEAFEEEFARLSGVRHAIGVGNGTDALLLALRTLGIGAGDEVITVANSWISTAASIALVGARPVFVDVREDFLIDPAQVERAITPRTKAILPVHLTGRCADVETLGAIAKRRGISLIEDAAQAAGAHMNGRPAGSLGEIGCFSFHPLKNLNAVGDGGMVTTNNDEWATRVRSLRNHGLRSRDEVAHWGRNSRLDTIQAAVLRVRLKHLPEVIALRQRNAAGYRGRLSSVVRCPIDRSQDVATYHLFMIQCDAREDLKRFLAAQGIETKVHYPTPLHLQPCSAALGYQRGDLPVTEAQAQRILSLPVHEHLSEEQVEWVSQSIRAFYGGCQ